MLAPVRMIVTYPLYMAMERAIFHSQTFEKTWSGLRPKLEKGVELIAQEVHPQGRNFIRRYVYQEPATRRICSECFEEMFNNEVMSLLGLVKNVRKDIRGRQKQILEWEKDLIAAPKKTWNILNSTQSNLKDKISRYKSKIEYDEKQIVVLLDKALDSLKARGVRIDREQLESLIESAEGEDLAAILSVADCVGQVLKRLESQLAESNPTPELSKTYAGFYMMCNRLYLEAVNRALYQIGKVYMKRVAGIEKKEAFKQINTAEEKLTSPNLSEAARATLKNNVKINHEILEVVKFYTRHLNKRTKELLEIREKAALNFEISLNTFMTMKIERRFGRAGFSNVRKRYLQAIFAFEPPALSALFMMSDSKNSSELLQDKSGTSNKKTGGL